TNRGDQSAQTAAQTGGLLAKVKSLLVPAAAILFLIALALGVTLLNRFFECLISGWAPRFEPYGNWLLLLVAELAIAFLASFAINVNKFSLHAMYRMRLIRAYLGASNTKRMPNPFTGFDPEDNLEMSALSKTKPMHVLNLCLNLVGGSKLAWQQRKAESF